MPSKNKSGPAAPADLKQTQDWFSKVVSRPLSQGENNFETDKGALVYSRNGVDGSERLSIYNRQYWFRFLDVMHEDYPCASRLLGRERFNEWSVRYLDRYKSDSPFLADLDEKFSVFMEMEYHDLDRDLVLEALGYDKAFDKAFDSESGEALSLQGLDAIKLALSPHATPLWLGHDWVSFRKIELQDPKSPAPSVREHGVLIYRHEFSLYEKEIPRGAYLLLKALEEPKSLVDLFEVAESDMPAEILADAEQNLTTWFRDWVELGWITRAD